MDNGIDAGVAVLDLVDAVGAATVTPLAAIMAPLATLYTGLRGIDRAHEEARFRGREVDHEQMCGALLYCLGRVRHPDRPEVVDRIGTHARDGARDAARFERLRPEAFAALRERVVTHHSEGEAAVYCGRDGTEIARRYEEDPIFRLGVDEARALRESDPSAFEARASEARALEAALDGARAGGRV
jgi:hypothetical protein